MLALPLRVHWITESVRHPGIGLLFLGGWGWNPTCTWRNNRKITDYLGCINYFPVDIKKRSFLTSCEF